MKFAYKFKSAVVLSLSKEKGKFVPKPESEKELFDGQNKSLTGFAGTLTICVDLEISYLNMNSCC